MSRGHVAMQVAVLGLLFTALGFVTDGCYALAAGTAGNWLKRSRGYLAVERYVSGVAVHRPRADGRLRGQPEEVSRDVAGRRVRRAGTG